MLLAQHGREVDFQTASVLKALWQALLLKLLNPLSLLFTNIFTSLELTNELNTKSYLSQSSHYLSEYVTYWNPVFLLYSWSSYSDVSLLTQWIWGLYRLHHQASFWPCQPRNTTLSRAICAPLLYCQNKTLENTQATEMVQFGRLTTPWF